MKNLQELAYQYRKGIPRDQLPGNSPEFCHDIPKQPDNSISYLKEYLVILTTSFYDMNQKIQTKKASKISGDSSSTVTRHACYVHWHCSIECCVKLSLIKETCAKSCPHFIRKLFQPNSCGEMCYIGKSYK